MTQTTEAIFLTETYRDFEIEIIKSADSEGEFFIAEFNDEPAIAGWELQETFDSPDEALQAARKAIDKEIEDRAERASSGSEIFDDYESLEACGRTVWG